MIKLQSVRKMYGKFVAVDNIDLDIKDGEILGIIGHNGAGKTTTIKMIVGLMSPTSGTVDVMGVNMAGNNTEIKRNIGYLPEESPLYENMTARQYLSFFAELYKIPSPVAAQRIDTILDSLKLSERDKYTGDLSKGMKRKVAIARTILHDPQLLVLDEPSSGLDPLTSFFIIDYLKTLKKQGKTIILSAHNLHHVEYVCDRVAIMKNGRILICDTVDSMRESLGRREYEIVFRADEDLVFDRREDNYVFSASDVGEIATMLNRISENKWALIDLSVSQSALEDMYVELMIEKQCVEMV